MDDSHPVWPDFRRRAVRQVVEVRVDATPAEHVRQLFGRTRETPVTTHLVQRVAVGVHILSTIYQVTLTQAPSLQRTHAAMNLG